jgi:hypothetical protein
MLLYTRVPRSGRAVLRGGREIAGLVPRKACCCAAQPGPHLPTDDKLQKESVVFPPKPQKPVQKKNSTAVPVRAITVRGRKCDAERRRAHSGALGQRESDLARWFFGGVFDLFFFSRSITRSRSSGECHRETPTKEKHSAEQETPRPPSLYSFASLSCGLCFRLFFFVLAHFFVCSEQRLVHWRESYASAVLPLLFCGTLLPPSLWLWCSLSALLAVPPFSCRTHTLSLFS